MKACFWLLLFPLFLFAQEEKGEKSHFIALYTVGVNWDADKTPNDQLYFKEHSAFLSKLRKEKTIIMGARYSDTGMIVLEAVDLESAQNLLHEDIALQKGLFNVVVHPFHAFYTGCID